MEIAEIAAIDVHGHYGLYCRKGLAIQSRIMSGGVEKVLERARTANIELTIVSPLSGLLPRMGADAAAGNEEAARVVEENPGLLQWVIVDPRRPATFAQAAERLRHPKCAGIKIHPEEHGYPIAREGGAIFEFAARHRAIVLTHSGEENSLPKDCVGFADRFPEVTLVLAHLGCGWDRDLGHQVRAIQASEASNIYVDTSSASSIYAGLIEWAVKEIGASRILFGTDTPLYSAAAQRRRIEAAEISDADKLAILRENAVRLLKPARHTSCNLRS